MNTITPLMTITLNGEHQQVAAHSTLADVVAAAAAVDLALQQQIAMPANNLLLVFGRAPVSVST